MHQTSRAALLGVLLALPFAVLAQQSPRTPDPADPAAPARPIGYESAITRPSAEPQGGAPTPDKLWRAANEAVAAPSGHAGHAAHQAAPAAPVPAPVREQPAPADHSKHHQAEATR